MQIFKYTARDEAGEKQEGKVEARDEKHAVQILRDKSWVVIDLKESHEGTSFMDKTLGKVSQTDIMNMTQQLSTMINAGLPLTDALDMLRVQSKPALARVINEIERDVQAGMSLADALGRHPKVFSSVYVELVRAGESSGKLDEVLMRLAKTEERAREFRQKTKGAMVYPIIVLIAMVLVVIVMMVVVIPQLSSMYDEFGAELPFATQLLISMSDFMVKFWWLGLAVVVGLMFIFRNYRRTDHGREVTDEWLLKIPIYGTLQTQLIMADFARTLALLVSAGISILQALHIVGLVVNNQIYKNALNEAERAVEKGQPLAATLAKLHVFPPLMAQMISVGEETGALDEVLIKVSKYFESEAENKIKNLTTALEPIIIIVLGVGVFFIVIAIIMPIYNLTSQF
jgi:type IV pilus assembly protein PilC